MAIGISEGDEEYLKSMRSGFSQISEADYSSIRDIESLLRQSSHAPVIKKLSMRERFGTELDLYDESAAATVQKGGTQFDFKK